MFLKNILISGLYNSLKILLVYYYSITCVQLHLNVLINNHQWLCISNSNIFAWFRQCNGGGILRYNNGNIKGTPCFYCLFQFHKLNIHHHIKRDWGSLMSKPGFDDCAPPPPPPPTGFLLLCKNLRLFLINWTRLGMSFWCADLLPWKNRWGFVLWILITVTIKDNY